MLLLINNIVTADRYVIVGCHYDSWTFGAVNPNSGTAVLMELSKAFSALQSKGAVHNFVNFVKMMIIFSIICSLMEGSDFYGELQQFWSDATWHPGPD